MSHYCPKCKVQSKAIASNKGFMIVDGKSIVAEGDKATCGARYIKISNLAVMSSGSGSGSSSSPKVILNTPIPSLKGGDLTNSFSRRPIQTLTEEEKLLTQEECKMIILHVWGDLVVEQNKLNQFPELSVKDRSYITNQIYFPTIDKDEGMSVISSMIGSFGSLTSKAAAAITKVILKDIAEMKAKSAAGKWWNNEARQDYFKVGWSGNPVDRFKEVNTSILKTLKLKQRTPIMLMINPSLKGLL